MIGLASSGVHSNGFSLVRRIVEEGERAGRFGFRDQIDELDTSVAGALLTPTRIYVKPVLHAMRDFELKGVVHVTGGGFPGNVPRVLPKGVRARIDPSSWPTPPIFNFIQREAALTNEEMLRVFNCGVGMILIVPREQSSDLIDRLGALGERAYPIGIVEAKQPDDDPILFGPFKHAE